MRTGGPKLIMALVFALALVGGVTAGMLAMRLSSAGSVSGITEQLPLCDELQLTPAQRNQLRSVWQQVQGKLNDCVTEGRRLDEKREDFLTRLLTDQQKKQYSPVYQEYQDRIAALEAQRDIVMRQAIEQTRQMLNSSQRKRYDEILASRLGNTAQNQHSARWLKAGAPASQPAPPSLLQSPTDGGPVHAQ